MKNSNKKNSEAIIQIQKLTKPIFEKYGVEKAYVFGSYARGDYDENSDIDIIIVAKNIRSLLIIGAILEALKQVLNKEVDLKELENEKDTEKVRETLLTLPGVGPKVADCILLFSTLKRFEVFPIDVWVRRVMNDLYIKNPDETKVNKREIEKLAKEKYGDLAGLAQQYLFYWKREA